MGRYISATNLDSLTRCDRLVYLDHHGDHSLRLELSPYQKWLIDQGRQHEAQVASKFETHNPDYQPARLPPVDLVPEAQSHGQCHRAPAPTDAELVPFPHETFLPAAPEQLRFGFRRGRGMGAAGGQRHLSRGDVAAIGGQKQPTGHSRVHAGPSSDA